MHKSLIRYSNLEKNNHQTNQLPFFNTKTKE